MALPPSETGFVGILDNDSYEQLFVATSPMRATIREEKRMTKFPVEDGTTRSDHMIQQPIEIAVDLVIQEEEARDMYLQLRQAWLDNRLLVVQTKVNNYSNMLIESMPHDETVELGNGIAIPVRFSEWRTIQPEYGSLPPAKVASKKQADSAKQGQKQTTTADAAQTKKASVLYGVFN